MRIVTWNIRGGLGMDGRRFIPRIAETLAALEPDIACLQEVHRRLPWSGMVDQPAELGRLLGMAALFHASCRLGPGAFGNLILTRFPARHHRGIRLPNGRERASAALFLERRAVQIVKLETPDGPLVCMNTHWSLQGGDRQDSAGRVAEAVRHEGAPLIFCGDFNARPDSPEIALLNEAGLSDSAVDCGPTYPSTGARHRIDYVWLHGLAARSARIHSTLASDHLPVVVEAELPDE